MGRKGVSSIIFAGRKLWGLAQADAWLKMENKEMPMRSDACTGIGFESLMDKGSYPMALLVKAPGGLSGAMAAEEARALAEQGLSALLGRAANLAVMTHDMGQTWTLASLDATSGQMQSAYAAALEGLLRQGFRIEEARAPQMWSDFSKLLPAFAAAAESGEISECAGLAPEASVRGPRL